MSQNNQADIKSLSPTELNQELVSIAKGMFIARFNKALGKEFNVNEIRAMKRRKAQIKAQLDALSASSQGGQ